MKCMHEVHLRQSPDQRDSVAHGWLDADSFLFSHEQDVRPKDQKALKTRTRQ